MKQLYRMLISVILTLPIILAGCASDLTHSNYDQGMSTYDNTCKSSDVFSKIRSATGKMVFIFDPNCHVWAIYDQDGNLIKTGPASGGKDYCPDIDAPCRTIVGNFTAYRESGPQCVSNEFPVGKGGAPMPDCIFFHDGYAIHGANVVPNYNTSHGCIHVKIADAKWIETEIKPGSTIIVLPYDEV